MHKVQFLKEIIMPCLQELDMDSIAARKLLMITAATETRLGHYVRQCPTGPALGAYGMERRTYYDNWDSVLQYKPELSEKVLKICNYASEPTSEVLMWDLRYATAMARIQYYRWPEKMPEPDNIHGLLKYYYKYWGPNPDKTSLEEVRSRVDGVLGNIEGEHWSNKYGS